MEKHMGNQKNFPARCMFLEKKKKQRLKECREEKNFLPPYAPNIPVFSSSNKNKMSKVTFEF